MPDGVAADTPNLRSAASLTPARFLGLDNERGALTPGARADLVALTQELRGVAAWRDGSADWGTVGVSETIIEASWLALVDAIEYKLFKDEDRG